MTDLNAAFGPEDDFDPSRDVEFALVSMVLIAKMLRIVDPQALRRPPGRDSQPCGRDSWPILGGVEAAIHETCTSD